MKEKLIIKNFGPIKSVDLDLGKITVLIGEQATGKSTIAKVLSICRYFSYIVNYAIEVDKQNEFHSNEQFLKGLRDWGIYGYLQEDSTIFYKNELYTFEFTIKSFEKKEVDIPLGMLPKNGKFLNFQTKIISNSKSFTKLLKELQSLKNDELTEKDKDDFFKIADWTPNENFYRLNVKKVMNNPLFIPAERGFQTKSFGREYLLSEAILDELSKIVRVVTRYEETRIDLLGLDFKNINGISYIKKVNETNFYPLHEAASGYHSAIPIILTVNHFSEIEKRQRTFIVEEPEINLFPRTQKKLMQFFVENINVNKHSFIIPTHSPYFLSAINDLLLAYKRGQKNEEETSKIIGKNMWLNPDDLSVYELKNGKASKIFNKKIGLISDNIIDDVSDEMNDEFERLLDIK